MLTNNKLILSLQQFFLKVSSKRSERDCKNAFKALTNGNPPFGSALEVHSFVLTKSDTFWNKCL